MINQYETVFIATPVLSEEQMKETVEKFKKFLTDRGAEIIYDDYWGLKKLCFQIQKKSSGFYQLLEFTAEGDILHDFETEFKRDERILRYLTVKLDKHAVTYNAKRRKLKEEAKKNKAQAAE